MKYMALDIGEKRVGVAVSDESGIIARPLLVLGVTDNFLLELGKVIDSERPKKIIFGTPRHQDGEVGENVKSIVEFANVVKHEYNVEVDFEDESQTSIEAEARLKKSGYKDTGIKEKIDAEAACIILESYLEQVK